MVAAGSASQTPPSDDFHSLSVDAALARLGSSSQGLSEAAARFRLRELADTQLPPPRSPSPAWLFLAQFKSPITLILIGCATLSGFLGDAADAAIILLIVLASAALGFWQEWRASDALARLLNLVRVTCTVLRDGAVREAPPQEIVPGDVLLLSAGSRVVADCLLLEARDLFVDQATLTGETFPVEKLVATLPAKTPLANRANMLYMGSHVVSGSGRAVAVRTGRATEFGKISQRLKLRPPETDFEHGVKRFGYFLMEVTFLLLLAIFVINVFLQRPVLESFVFALALAVGLTPQLLPAIVTVNLAHGARRMAASQVIVRRLAAIENFGAMTVLCSDKTGTLTEGKIRVQAAVDYRGQPSAAVLEFAYLNSSFETGYSNPIDDAIRATEAIDLASSRKLDEVPYDFLRKRLGVLVNHRGRKLLIVKGAVKAILEVCTSVTHDGHELPLDEVRAEIQRQFHQFSEQGFRTLAVAVHELSGAETIRREDEAGLLFIGFLVLSDSLKEGIQATVERLSQLGVRLKLVTGDNALVAAHVAAQIGLSPQRLVTGTQLREVGDDALLHLVGQIDTFAEIEPNQKERIILALKKSGEVVGYLGDGINDATALHAADVGISVDCAADVAREAADIVLLKRDLAVLIAGIRAGRTTFANTLKYIFMATSANFGNMFSMAGASLFVPFLPLLPKQILLMNLLTDVPEMAIAGDRVDPELVDQPRRWDIGFIRKFMLVFGAISSIFDLATFVALLAILGASTEQFRTAWFVESVVSASLIVLVVRSRRPFWQSRPSQALTIATLTIVALTVALTYSGVTRWLAFEPLPPRFHLAIAVIVTAYVITAEIAKKIFYRRVRL
jgi:Mg2+-importing ATPase